MSFFAIESVFKDTNNKAIFLTLPVRFLRADKVFDGQRYLTDGTILALDHQNLLKDILSSNAVDAGNVEHLKGTILPGFVNTHCHLELSHFRGKINRHTGLSEFAKDLMSKRPQFTAEIIKEEIENADAEMYANGIVAVGDICNTSDTFLQKTKSKIHYHSFIELIGLHPDFANVIVEKGTALFRELKSLGLKGSLAPHAPYSVSRELAVLIAKFDDSENLPVSIHNQESQAEDDFYRGINSGINGLYDFLKLDISYFKAPGMSSLKFLNEAISCRPRIFVHNTFTNKNDIDIASDKGTYWCFCPAANLYIENRLPEFENFAGNQICFGTDSLASNDRLDVLAEINILKAANCQIDDVTLLKALTFGGAQAMGVGSEFGSLIKGKNAGLNLIQTQNNKVTLTKKIC